ncbi:2-nitropropane dioxygenase [Paraburkholderia acidicola]|uniref:2-nitropropane dioxygenase n=1 Tax=Paraburkholderia acidicola TaxID=1912599 RepID=A0A2A4F7I5_9BURK|nr:PfaD family polyunsaturated fatty acid/polyketide biosynthesis protein [Paraburkholderia acidicola]PCE28610.1 2-nitropropane dioxygenase [Paraburkholderia acidicola]
MERLGSAAFKQDHGVDYPYVAGSMAKGIASAPMVINMGKAGFLSYFGTGGVDLASIEQAILDIQAALSAGQPYGMNLLSNASTPQAEMDTVDLFLKHGVRRVEASAYMQITAPLVKYRARGLRRNAQGAVVAQNMILAKLSRPEVATLFLSPPPEKVLAELVAEGALSAAEAELAKHLPMADDICVEADSGGHTDMGVLSTLLPSIVRLRDEMVTRYGYTKTVRVGGAGGIGTPEAAATAFILGADFILTGSINQCTVEAGTSEAAKDLLQQVNVQDMDYCPSGSLFELGAKTQVLKKGVFFPARANKLYELWKNHAAWEDIEAKTRAQIQEKYFMRTFEDVYAETRAYFLKAAPGEIEKAEKNPKHKMALVFRWYFVHTMRLAMSGSSEQKVDYQIHCGPAMGAFNQWVKGTELESWRNRRVADIARLLLEETVQLLNRSFFAMTG